MTKLKLGPITETKPVKVTLELPANLHRDLTVYGQLISADGTAVDPIRLIVPMLERFVATDRGFAKARRAADPFSPRKPGQ